MKNEKKNVLDHLILILTFLSVFIFLSCNKKTDDTQISISNYVEGENMPGGKTTVSLDGVLAFSSQSKNISVDNTENFFVGNSFFTKDWVLAPASTTARDGLGPFFNAKACATCHTNDGRGRPPTFDGEKNHGLLLRLSIPGFGSHGESVPDPNYGDQLQDQSVPGVAGKGDFTISYESISGQYQDGTTYDLQKPIYNLFTSSYGAIS